MLLQKNPFIKYIKIYALCASLAYHTSEYSNIKNELALQLHCEMFLSDIFLTGEKFQTKTEFLRPIWNIWGQEPGWNWPHIRSAHDKTGAQEDLDNSTAGDMLLLTFDANKRRCRTGGCCFYQL